MSERQSVSDSPLIEVEGLRKHFPVSGGFLRRTAGLLKAVDGVSFEIWPGKSYGLVGESGCGKSTTAKMILRLERPTSGTIRFQGEDIYTLDQRGRKNYRGSVQAVFQDPWSSLNPRMKVGSIIAEPLEINAKLTGSELRERVAALLQDVGLHPSQADLYPHEFSGGQRQRITIARALALNPALIVLDEPVSALDVSIRAQIMNLLKDLQERYALSYLLIAHNLSTVRHMCDRVGVMYLGQIIEEADDLFDNPLHPYTKALISSALPSHPDMRRDRVILAGEVPSPVNPPSGCRFNPRCDYAMPHCSEVNPQLKEIAPNHFVSCHLFSDDSGHP